MRRCAIRRRVVRVLVDVEDLGEVLVRQDRVGQHDLAARIGSGLQQVPLGADLGLGGGDQFLADRIQRRIGHLREELAEVVEQQSRPFRQHRDRGVGPHRPDRLDAGAGHRRYEYAQFFSGVAEGALAQGDRRVLRRQAETRRQVFKVREPVGKPVPIGLSGHQVVLDLVVAHDAALRSVHEEHAPWLQAALANDAGLIDVGHADFGCHHDETIGGDPVAGGPQAVAVEHGAHDGAVGEGDAGRTVPRLHRRGMEFVEIVLVLGHAGMVFPGLWNHHQHGMGQAPPAEMEQLEHFVEAGGVRRAGRAHGIRALELVVPVGIGEQRARQRALSCPHPVAVSHHRVDLAVVGEHAIRVCERPRGERVGAEARVQQRERRFHAGIDQVGIELRELAAGQHSLVYEDAARQRGKVRGGIDLVLGALASDIDTPFKIQPVQVCGGRCSHEQHPEHRHRIGGELAERRRVGGNLSPAEHLQSFFDHDRFDGRRGSVGIGARQEGCADRVAAGWREFEVADVAQESVGNLNGDPDAVADVRLSSGGAAMVEVDQALQGLIDDGPARHTRHVGNEAHTARVVLECRVVEALCRRRRREGAGAYRRPVFDSWRCARERRVSSRSVVDGHRRRPAELSAPASPVCMRVEFPCWDSVAAGTSLALRRRSLPTRCPMASTMSE